MASAQCEIQEHSLDSVAKPPSFQRSKVQRRGKFASF